MRSKRQLLLLEPLMKLSDKEVAEEGCIATLSQHAILKFYPALFGYLVCPGIVECRILYQGVLSVFCFFYFTVECWLGVGVFQCWPSLNYWSYERLRLEHNSGKD